MNVTCPRGHSVEVAEPDRTATEQIIGVTTGLNGQQVTHYGYNPPTAFDPDWGVERPGVIVKCNCPDPTSDTGLCGEAFFVEVQ